MFHVLRARYPLVINWADEMTGFLRGFGLETSRLSFFKRTSRNNSSSRGFVFFSVL